MLDVDEFTGSAMSHPLAGFSVSQANDAVRARMQREFARDLLQHHRDELRFDTEDEIVRELRMARGVATDLGLVASDLRVRFLQIHLMVYPDFWTDPVLALLLRQPSGTPEQRFLDVCGAIKVSYTRGGYEHLIWW